MIYKLNDEISGIMSKAAEHSQISDTDLSRVLAHLNNEGISTDSFIEHMNGFSERNKG